MAENNIGYFVGGIGRFKQIQIVGLDKAARQKVVAYPVGHPLPEIAADQNNRTGRNLAGLHQRQAFKQLVQRAEAAGHHHIRHRMFHKHHFAREKMLEFNRQILIRIGLLFMRQHDIEADGGTASGKRALVGRLHNPRPAAGNHREARIREAAGNQFGQQVVGMVYRRARAAVYADGGIDGAQFFACLDELRHDFQQMIAFARLNFVARAVGQDGVRQLVLQRHGGNSELGKRRL